MSSRQLDAGACHGVGEAECGGLPEPDAGPEEQQPEAEQAREGGEHGAEGDEPGLPVCAAGVEDALDGPGDVEDFASVVADAVGGHVAGDDAGAEHPEQRGERIERHAVELLREDDDDGGGDVVEHHAGEGD